MAPQKNNKAHSQLARSNGAPSPSGKARQASFPYPAIISTPSVPALSTCQAHVAMGGIGSPLPPSNYINAEGHSFNVVVWILESSRSICSASDVGQPPRPQNCFICYRTWQNWLVQNSGQAVSECANTKTTQAVLSQDFAKLWNNLDPVEKKFYKAVSKVLKDRFKVTHPTYTYKPAKMTKALVNLKDAVQRQKETDEIEAKKKEAHLVQSQAKPRKPKMRRVPRVPANVKPTFTPAAASPSFDLAPQSTVILTPVEAVPTPLPHPPPSASEPIAPLTSGEFGNWHELNAASCSTVGASLPMWADATSNSYHVPYANTVYSSSPDNSLSADFNAYGGPGATTWTVPGTGTPYCPPLAEPGFFYNNYDEIPLSDGLGCSGYRSTNVIPQEPCNGGMGQVGPGVSPFHCLTPDVLSANFERPSDKLDDNSPSLLSSLDVPTIQGENMWNGLAPYASPSQVQYNGGDSEWSNQIMRSNFDGLNPPYSHSYGNSVQENDVAERFLMKNVEGNKQVSPIPEVPYGYSDMATFLDFDGSSSTFLSCPSMHRVRTF